jgi:hypothetical protein
MLTQTKSRRNTTMAKAIPNFNSLELCLSTVAGFRPGTLVVPLFTISTMGKNARGSHLEPLFSVHPRFVGLRF